MNKTVEQAVEYYGGEFPHGLGRDAVIVWVDKKRAPWIKPGFQAVEWGAMLHDGFKMVCTREEFMEAAAQWKAKQGKEWVDGLPPVGVPIMARLRGDVIWAKTEIIAIDGNDIWLREFPISNWHNVEFRQIMSDRDKAIEEMTKAYMEGTTGHCGGIKAIYDAGFRRQISRKDAVKKITLAAMQFDLDMTEDIIEGLATELGFDQ